MKSGSLATRLVTLAAALCVLAYFGMQIYQYYSSPLTTAPVYEYQVEDAVTVTGYVIRNEAILTGGGGGSADLARSEGERVGRGQRVAVLYQDQAARDRQQEIETMEAHLEQLEYARTATANSEVSLKLDSSISLHIRSLHADLSGNDLADADKHIGELRSLVSKRDYTYRDSTDLTEQIASLKAQLKDLKAAASSGISVVRAPKSGIYSAEVDGYEAVLTPAGLDTLTPSVLSALAPDGSTSELGKLIYGDTWYFAAVLSVETAKAFQPGDETLLRFAKGEDRALSVQVHSVGLEEQGAQTVIFSSPKYLSELTLLRKQSADIISNQYSGLRVPQNALRVTTTTREDDDGVTREVKTTGVYCLVGVTALFKAVDVQYTGDGFCLVTAASVGEKVRLRPGDQVIISAGDLYDGKVVG